MLMDKLLQVLWRGPGAQPFYPNWDGHSPGKDDTVLDSRIDSHHIMYREGCLLFRCRLKASLLGQKLIMG